MVFETKKLEISEEASKTVVKTLGFRGCRDKGRLIMAIEKGLKEESVLSGREQSVIPQLPLHLFG